MLFYNWCPTKIRFRANVIVYIFTMARKWTFDGLVRFFLFRNVSIISFVWGGIWNKTTYGRDFHSHEKFWIEHLLNYPNALHWFENYRIKHLWFIPFETFCFILMFFEPFEKDSANSRMFYSQFLMLMKISSTSEMFHSIFLPVHSQMLLRNVLLYNVSRWHLNRI